MKQLYLSAVCLGILLAGSVTATQSPEFRTVSPDPGSRATSPEPPASPDSRPSTVAQGAPSNGSVEMGPQFAGGELIRPTNFREWTFVTAGLGMTYSEPTGAPRTPNFTNVWVNTPAYRSFMTSGKWPDKTMFILEVRASQSEGSINKGGHFQSNLVVIEASVKDQSRFPGNGWAYFDFGRDMKEKVAPLASSERCYACHGDNTAVDNTFVQFYPTLMEVARKMGTVRPGF